MADIDFTEALEVAGAEWCQVYFTGRSNKEAREDAVRAAAPLIEAQVRAQIAAEVRAQRDGFLASPRLDPSWIAGWHAATDHHAVRIARGES